MATVLSYVLVDDHEPREVREVETYRQASLGASMMSWKLNGELGAAHIYNVYIFEVMEDADKLMTLVPLARRTGWHGNASLPYNKESGWDTARDYINNLIEA